MYRLVEGQDILSDNNRWYDGDTSAIYKQDDLLFKIYKKKEPYKRHVLDILIANENLRDIGVLPIAKIKTQQNNDGMVMHYIPHTQTFRERLKQGIDCDEFINIIITLSDNLKRINAEGIHFSDLHHNNILIRHDNKPLYIDFDDAVVHEYNSTHICYIAHAIHDVEHKGYDYEGELMQYGNLDQECLFIMLLDYLLGIYIERKDYKSYQKMLEKLTLYLPHDFIKAISIIKNDSKEVIPYPYYVGDFLKQDQNREKCKKLRRDAYAYHRF